jgi:DNA-directed RNA polymerase specialized sigma24 family protein
MGTPKEQKLQPAGLRGARELGLEELKSFIDWAHSSGAIEVEFCGCRIKFREPTAFDVAEAQIKQMDDDLHRTMSGLPDEEREKILQQRRDELMYGSA